MYSPFLLLFHNLLGKFSLAFSALGILAVDVNFRDQITLGTILLGGLIVILTGIFTIRSKIAATWHDVADAERTAKEMAQRELTAEKIDRIQFEKDQQELRHALKTEIATRDLQLQALQAKTDLTTALEALREIAKAQENRYIEAHQLLMDISNRLPKTNGGTT